MMKGDIIDKMMVMIGLGAINLPLIYWGLVFFPTPSRHMSDYTKTDHHQDICHWNFWALFPQNRNRKIWGVMGGVTYCSVVDFEYLD